MAETKAPEPLALLRRRDQGAVAALVFLGAAGLLGWWLAAGGHRGELVDLDDIEVRKVPFQVDLNSAEWPELAQLPGIGEVLAQRIVAAREREGPFDSPQALTRVHGIGPKTVEAVEPFLAPLDENR